MTTGILTHAKNFLVGNWKAHDQVYAEKVPFGEMAFNGQILNPASRHLLHAYKGLIYAVTNIRANALGELPLRVYLMKETTEKSAFSTRSYSHPLMVTREVSRKRKDYIFSKAIPGSRLSAAVDLEEVVKHPLTELLHNVNGHINGFDLIHLTSAGMDLEGNTYWLLLRNGLDVPAAIFVLRAEYMSIVPDKDNFIKEYIYKRGTVEIHYPAEDIVHFKYVTPASHFYGAGNLVAAHQAYDLREYMVNFEQQMFKSGGIPKQILVAKGRVSPDDAEMIKGKWKALEAGDIAVVGNEEFDLIEPSYVTARDMGYKEGLRYSMTEIARIWGIPVSMLDTTDVNRANDESGERKMARDAVAPFATRIDQKITEQLAPQFDENLLVMFDNPVKEDAEAAREDRKVAIELGIETRNEARRQMGLEDVEGGDELLIPQGLVPLSDIGAVAMEQQAAFLGGRALEMARERKRS
jgi:HK97 family phage portal protein